MEYHTRDRLTRRVTEVNHDLWFPCAAVRYLERRDRKVGRERIGYKMTTDGAKFTLSVDDCWIGPDLSLHIS